MPANPTPAPTPTTPADRAIAETRAWVRRAVVGLNLCPFAKAPLVKGQVRFVVCESADPRVLLDALCTQMRELAAADAAVVETTLLIHPAALVDFDEFNEFLDAADAALEDLGLDGVLQVASFHPRYQFAGTGADDLSNVTNRSPHPTLHLLREASVERATSAFPEAQAIFETNIATLDELGAEGWARLQAQCHADASCAGNPLD